MDEYHWDELTSTPPTPTDQKYPVFDDLIRQTTGITVALWSSKDGDCPWNRSSLLLLAFSIAHMFFSSRLKQSNRTYVIV